jgi:2-hydroxychromene-2-carboxylate isomerase
VSGREDPQLVWYFDFISPYSYLQFAAYPELLQAARLRPVLFAGLLNHWGGKGPAEIPAKRVQTYRYTVWLARRRGIAMTYPPAHPFNPIHALRLALALECRYDAVKTIFEFIWKQGRSVNDEWPALAASLGVGDAEALVAQPWVKDALAENGRAAAARGVYGVPTFDTGKELFWGVDATDMLLDFLADPGLFDAPEMRRVAALPVGAARRP